jgi:hypothetical protein
VIDLPGRGIGAASETLVLLGQRCGYTVGPIGPGTFRLERATRPGWATALAIVLMPLFGLGLLFLRIRDRESIVVTIHEERSGTTARVVGFIDPEIFAALSAPQPATSGDGTSAGSVPEGEPTLSHPLPQATMASKPGLSTVVVDDVAATVTRRVIAQSSVAELEPSWSIVIPGGGHRPLRRPTIVGRDPVCEEGEDPLAIDDRSLSNSHVRLIPSSRGVLLTDLFSTNGTSLRTTGSTRNCEPGTLVVAPHEGIVIAGEVEMQVERRGI